MMPMDCSQCDVPSVPVTGVLPCGLPATTVYKDPATTPPSGEKQIPLLTLMYELVVQNYQPAARKVRATWRTAKYGAKGQLLAYPWHTVAEHIARAEVQDMVGMILAQVPHILPIWAQVPRAQQIEIAADLSRMLKGEPTQSQWISKLQFELLQGTAHHSLQEDMQRKALAIQNNRAYIEQLRKELSTVRARSETAIDRMMKLQKEIQEAQAEQQRLLEGQHLIQENQTSIEHDWPDLFEMGTIITGDKRAMLIDLMDDEDRARADTNRYDQLALEFARYTEQRNWLQEQINSRQAEFDGHAERVATTTEKLEFALEQAFLRDLLLQNKLDESREVTTLTRVYGQSTLQDECLTNDFALFAGNYEDPQDQKELIAVLKSGAVPRAMFLLMDPELKYSNDKKSVCRIRKFLTSPDVQAAFTAMDRASLIQPGPYAKLGIFVMNALRAGSYDDRHRKMVQTELDLIVKGMQEFGLDPTIVCHSCGSDEASGDAGLAKTAWIRDHNPPTALYKLGRAVYHGKLGLPDWAGNSKTNGQILLPQCRECSKRQGSLMGKVTAMIGEISPLMLADPSFDLRAHLQSELDAGCAEDWPDFVRLVCQPRNGWLQPSNLSADLATVPWDKLVTSGGPGSFDGIDESLLKNIGTAVGCHTCTDVPRQTDPYRNIFWIADHQPPTALVARGLRELPQIVYPQCWKCSSEQSQKVSRMARLFDRCFGKDFKTSWAEGIKTRFKDTM